MSWFQWITKNNFLLGCVQALTMFTFLCGVCLSNTNVQTSYFDSTTRVGLLFGSVDTKKLWLALTSTENLGRTEKQNYNHITYQGNENYLSYSTRNIFIGSFLTMALTKLFNSKIVRFNPFTAWHDLYLPLAKWWKIRKLKYFFYNTWK